MQDRIKEHNRDIRLARTKTSAVSEHAHNTWHKPLWNEVKFIDRDPYYYTRRVKEAIHRRLYPDNINTIKKTQQQESRATADRRGSKSLSETARIEMHQSEPLKKKTTNHSRASCFIRSRTTSRPRRPKKISSMQSKCRDLHQTWLHRETNGKFSFYCYSPRWITTACFTKSSLNFDF